MLHGDTFRGSNPDIIKNVTAMRAVLQYRNTLEEEAVIEKEIIQTKPMFSLLPPPPAEEEIYEESQEIIASFLPMLAPEEETFAEEEIIEEEIMEEEVLMEEEITQEKPSTLYPQ